MKPFCAIPLCTTAWSTMTESVGNETIETYWCFSSRNWHWPNVITWHDLKKKGSVGYVYATKKNKPLMVNFKFAKLHCYQQIQSFLVMPYFPHCKNFVILPLIKIFFCYTIGDFGYRGGSTVEIVERLQESYIWLMSVHCFLK
jgi:hypothetical protein